MGVFSLFTGKITVFLWIILGISLLGNLYLNNKNNTLREEIVRLEEKITNLSSLIEKQNQAIKELEANSSNLKTEYEEISEKYEKIKLNKVNAKEYAKKNNISVNESMLILEKNNIQRGLDEFFKKNR